MAGSPLKTGLAESKLAPTPEEFEKLLHHSYLVASEAEIKLNFFKQEDTKISSTLILLDLLKNWGHPVTKVRFGCQKKGKPVNNLLLLEVDQSWNQNFVKFEDKKFKSFEDWGAHSVHVSDLICFRQSFKDKYNFTRFEDLCYDIDTEMRNLEYQWQLRK